MFLEKNMSVPDIATRICKPETVIQNFVDQLLIHYFTREKKDIKYIAKVINQSEEFIKVYLENKDSHDIIMDEHIRMTTRRVRLDADYYFRVKKKKQQFIEEVSDNVYPLLCQDIIPGSIILVLYGEHERMQVTCSRIRREGITLPSFGQFPILPRRTMDYSDLLLVSTLVKSGISIPVIADKLSYNEQDINDYMSGKKKNHK